MSPQNESKRVPTNAGVEWPRVVNAVLGLWLCLSVVLWPHSRWQFANTLVAGVLIIVFALGACVIPRVRFLNTLLSVYLFLAAWFYHSDSVAEMLTQWHNAIIALWTFLVSVLHDAPDCTGSTASGAPPSRLSATR